MATYAIPEVVTPEPLALNEVVLVANGDLRQSANEVCWAAQAGLERMLTEAFLEEGIKLRRAHPVDPVLKHGFIHSQRMGMDVFEHIHPDAPIVVAEAVWQYSYHVLAGLSDPSRPHSHGRQLVRPVARPGGHAESERLPAQGRRAFQHPCGARTSTTRSSGSGLRDGSRTSPSPTNLATCMNFLLAEVGPAERTLGAALAARVAQQESRCSPSSTRAAWAWPTPSSKTHL